MINEKDLQEIDIEIKKEDNEENLGDITFCYIEDDKQAERFLRKESEEQARIDRLIALCESEMSDLKARLDGLKARKEQQSWYKAQLMMYFNSLPDSAKKKTKTQTKYELLHGSLIKKNGGFKTERDDSRIVEWAKVSAPQNIETTYKVKWAELKKDCDIGENGCVYKPTGEVIDGVEVIPQTDTFEIKMDFGGEQ